jgi:hypothetical protein
MTNNQTRWICGVGAVVLLAASAAADTPGRHPRYIHARTDLRTAQLLLRVHDEPNVMRHVDAVHAEVEAAIHEVDRAAVIDRKDWMDRPPIDANLDRPGRFRKAMELLVSARRDIGEEEDNPRAKEWRNAAFRHIDAAIDQLRRAARDLKIDRLEGR